MRKVFLLIIVFLVSTFMFGNNSSFSISKTGTGKQSIIFIPGFACSGNVWNETVKELQDNYTCYVLTMAGFSGVMPEENPSFEKWKTQIANFVKNEKIEKPILIGHSMGGGLALAIAADFPDLIKKIVVVDALPCLSALTNPNFRTNTEEESSSIINHIIAMDDEQFVQMQKISVAGFTTDSLKYEEIVNWGLKSDRKTYAKIFCDFSNTDLRERIKNITVPSLILLESHFKNIEFSIKEQYKNLSAMQLKFATKGLHFLMFDDKDWFMYQVNEFIKE